MAWDLRPFVSWTHREYEPAVRAGDRAGEYATHPGGPAHLYGTADLACVLWTIGRLGPDDRSRSQWADVFAQYQDPLTGHYVEGGRASHVELHVTAYALGALELLGLSPTRPLRFADGYRSPRAAAAFVDALEGHLDPATGMFGDDKPPAGDTDQIGGTFHYAFFYEHAHRPLPHPQARIDAVLGLQRSDRVWDPDNPHWLTLDALYLLACAARRTDHRRPSI